MEEIFARLGGDSQFVLLALIFGAVFLVAAGIGFLVTRSPASARLEAGSKPEASTLNVGVKLRPKAGRWFDNMFVKRAIEPFVPHDEANLSSLRKRLVQAGYMQPWAVTVLFISRIVCAIVLPILALIWRRSSDCTCRRCGSSARRIIDSKRSGGRYPTRST